MQGMAGATAPRNGERTWPTLEARVCDEVETVAGDVEAKDGLDVPLQVWLHEEFSEFRQALVTDIQELLLNTAVVNRVDGDKLAKKGHASGCGADCPDDPHVANKTLLLPAQGFNHLETSNRTIQCVELQHGSSTEDLDIPGTLPSGNSAGNPLTLHPRCQVTGISTETASEAVNLGVVPSAEMSRVQSDTRGRRLVSPSSWGSSLGDDLEDREKSRHSLRNLTSFWGGQEENRDLDQEIYDVTNYYYDRGCAQAVARNDTFEKVTLTVIAVNALYIGVDAEFNDAASLFDAFLPFVVFENLFCVFFSFEWGVRFFAFRRKLDCLRDFWFKFDSCLVVLMVFETWLMPLITVLTGSSGGSVPVGPLRLLRLLRLTRMARLMRSMPELLTMIKGMKASARAVGSSLLMVAMLIYVFAIVMHMALNDDERMKEYFGTLPLCMWTLLLDGTLMDNTGAVLARLRENADITSSLSVGVFMAFILLSAMTVMNMLIGVLCEVVSTVAQNEKDEAAIRVMKDSILVQLKRFDVNNNGCISMEELSDVMRDPQAREVLEMLEVDMGYLMDLQLLLYHDANDEVRIQTIMDLILASRGDLPTTVTHLVRCQAFMRSVVMGEVSRLQDSLEASFKESLAKPANPPPAQAPASGRRGNCWNLASQLLR